MAYQYFEWEEYVRQNPDITFPTSALEDMILINPEERTVWLSRHFSTWVFGNSNRVQDPLIPFDELGRFINMDNYEGLRAEYYRILEGKEDSASAHVSIYQDDTPMSAMAHMYRVQGTKHLLCFLSIDYAPIREFEAKLNQTIKELEWAKNINELILEGSSDYIYQLDVVNNICTFSSKATEVLDLDTPTFSNAMNRLMEFIVPEDRRVFLDSYTPFLTGQSKYHTAEYRCITRTGDIIWISCRGKGMHDENGNPLLIAGSLMDITENKKHEEQIHQMLYYDDLTGLKNKLSFTTEIEAALKAPSGQGSIVFFNINKLKTLNEMFGHKFGNKVIKSFADMLMLFFYGVRGVYRIGESEFMLHLDKTNRRDILLYLAPFLNILQKGCTVEDHQLFLDINVAVLLYPEHGETVDELLDNGNQLMYQLARNGSSEVAFYDSQSENDESKRFLLEAELRKEVLTKNYEYFRLVYQPIIKEVEGQPRWAGAEALLRYNNPAAPGVRHMDMIMTLEYSGLILPVGRYVIRQAVKNCAKWRQKSQDAVVHVNLAAQQITDAQLIPFIIETCAQAGLPHEALVLELTETSIVKNFDLAIQFCKTLKENGFGVALDDFGAGYSGFNYLRELPLSEIKIDIACVRDIHLNEFNQTVVRFVNSIAAQKELAVCAEGVETIEELEIIRRYGSDYIQGFYFERPIEEEQFNKLFPTKCL